MESEQIILGAILLDGSRIGAIRRSLPVEAMTDSENKEIYKTMLELEDNGIEISVASLIGAMGSEHAARIGEISKNAITTGVKYHVNLVRNRHALSLLAHFGKYTSAIADNANPATGIKDIIDNITNELHAIVLRSNPDAGAKRFDDIKEEVVKQLEQRRVHGPTLLSTHIDALDAVLMGGLEPSDFVVIGGRPNMGKTKLALEMARAMASNGVRVGYLSAEMTNTQVVDRSLQAAVQATKKAMRYPNKMTEEAFEGLLNSIEGVSLPTLLIDDTPGITPSHISGAIKQMKAALGGLDVVFIDYLQQIVIKRLRGETESSSIEKFAYWLKNMTKEHNVCIVLLSQLSRDVEKRNDKRPYPSDLRNSGGVEQAADKVWFVYRDEVYDPETEFPNIMEVLFRKDRTGISIGTAYLYNNPSTGGLTSLTVDDAGKVKAERNEVDF